MTTSNAIKSEQLILNASSIPTPLGPMISIADEQKLYLLEFADGPRLDKKIEKIRHQYRADIINRHSLPSATIENELTAYFSGALTLFQTPILIDGTDFQKRAWLALQAIPYAETRSYLSQAKALGHPNAFRAVANANGANPIAIVIPCHRIIHHDGNIGGYAGGKKRKQWLIHHEKQNSPH